MILTHRPGGCHVAVDHPDYKIPRYVHLVEEFPMAVTGKIRKVEMRECSVELLGLTAPTILGR